MCSRPQTIDQRECAVLPTSRRHFAIWGGENALHPVQAGEADSPLASTFLNITLPG
ncbi:MAG: hypothetical protein ACLTXH_05035 [Enterobacter hormaechei]